MFLLIFLVNYIYCVCNSYINLIQKDRVELLHVLDDCNKEESEKNEKENEIEDSDEYIFSSYSIYQDFAPNNKFNILCKFIELSFFKEIDSPPPNC